MSNKLDLEAIRKRAEAATEGNWYYTSLGSYYISPDIEDGVELGEAYSEADAEFIANARQDVPALIAEVERLRAENKRLSKERESFKNRMRLFEKMAKHDWKIEECSRDDTFFISDRVLKEVGEDDE